MFSSLNLTQYWVNKGRLVGRGLVIRGANKHKQSFRVNDNARYSCSSRSEQPRSPQSCYAIQRSSCFFIFFVLCPYMTDLVLSSPAGHLPPSCLSSSSIRSFRKAQLPSMVAEARFHGSTMRRTHLEFQSLSHWLGWLGSDTRWITTVCPTPFLTVATTAYLDPQLSRSASE